MTVIDVYLAERERLESERNERWKAAGADAEAYMQADHAFQAAERDLARRCFGESCVDVQSPTIDTLPRLWWYIHKVALPVATCLSQKGRDQTTELAQVYRYSMSCGMGDLVPEKWTEERSHDELLLKLKRIRDAVAARVREFEGSATSTTAPATLVDRKPSGASEKSVEKADPIPFNGGTMVFHEDRVEICDVDICSGPRSRSRRVVLELLSKQKPNGSFVAYSGGALYSAARQHGAKGSVAGWIRDLRDAITDTLLAEASICCGREEVILSGDQGYRFAGCVDVQFAATPTIRDITDTGLVGDVPNEDVPIVLNDLNHAEAKRQEWILEQLGNGVRLKAPDVARQFQCSAKTAQRALGTLKDAGLIDYVGSTRTGYYRLCDPPGEGP